MARRSKLRPPGPTGSSGKAATVVGAGDGEKAAPREWKRLLAGGALLAVVTAIAYVPAMRGDFVWDDDDYVTKNACLRDLSGLGRIWFQPGAVSQYYPLSYSSFWVDYQCWKLTPAAYHIHNVLLHVATAMLLWMVLRRLGVPGAFVAAAVFALHPVHVESVGWITERKNVLSGLLAMATVLVYLRFAGVPSGGSTSTNGAERQALPRPVQEHEGTLSHEDQRRWGLYGLAMGLFALSLLAKTVTCTLPAVLLVVLWWKRPRLAWRDIWPLAPMLVLGLAMAGVTAWMENITVRAEAQEWGFGPLGRLILAGRALCFYAQKLLAPYPLVFVYPRWEINAAAVWQFAFPVIVVALIVTLWLLRKRIGKGPLAGVLIFAGTLAPALGLAKVYYMMNYSYVADHFQYLASIGLIAVGVAAATVGIRRFAGRRTGAVSAGASAAVLVAMGAATWMQGTAYSDLETLWRHTLAHNERCWLAYNNLGIVFGARAEEPSRPAEERLALMEQAAGQFRKALNIVPDYARTHNNLGHQLYLMARLRNGQDGSVTEAQCEPAIGELKESIRLEPRDPLQHNNLGKVYMALGKNNLAKQEFQEAIRCQVSFADAYNNLGVLDQNLGQLPEAAEHFRQALKHDANQVQAMVNLAALLGQQGAVDQASALLSRATQIDPSNLQAQVTLGNLAMGRRDLVRAVDCYERALRIDPACAEAHNNLGVALEQSGRMDDAIVHYAAAVRISPDYADAKRNLQDAQARRGK